MIDTQTIPPGQSVSRVWARSKRLVLAAAMTAGLTLTAFVPAAAAHATNGCQHADSSITATSKPDLQKAVVCLINQQRALHGESALRDNAHLDSAATQHSQDMVTAGYFDHVSPTGSTPLDRIQASGYLVRGHVYELGENIEHPA